MVKLSDALHVSLDYLLKNCKNLVTGKVKYVKLNDQFIQINALPKQNCHMLKALLDACIKIDALPEEDRATIETNSHYIYY